MRSKDLLGLVLGLTLTGALAAPAAAAPVTTDYIATPAAGGGHAFWLPPLIPGGADTTMWFAVPGGGEASLQVTIDTANPANNAITFVGSTVSSVDPNLTFDFLFTFGPAQSVPAGYDGKRELPSGEYVENGGTIDTDTWTYFDMLSGSFTGTGAMSGASLSFFQKPEDGSKPFQFGVGANGKNTGLGYSGWLGWTVGSQPTNGLYTLANSGTAHGDINIDLEVDPTTTTTIVPEPSSVALFGLGLLGFGVITSRRRKRGQTAEADAGASATTV